MRILIKDIKIMITVMVATTIREMMYNLEPIRIPMVIDQNI